MVKHFALGYLKNNTRFRFEVSSFNVAVNYVNISKTKGILRTCYYSLVVNGVEKINKKLYP